MQQRTVARHCWHTPRMMRCHRAGGKGNFCAEFAGSEDAVHGHEFSRSESLYLNFGRYLVGNNLYMFYDMVIYGRSRMLFALYIRL